MHSRPRIPPAYENKNTKLSPPSEAILSTTSNLVSLITLLTEKQLVQTHFTSGFGN